jgi:hypothetical protein
MVELPHPERWLFIYLLFIFYVEDLMRKKNFKLKTCAFELKPLLIAMRSVQCGLATK